jgi:hypothetical protein
LILALAAMATVALVTACGSPPTIPSPSASVPVVAPTPSTAPTAPPVGRVTNATVGGGAEPQGTYLLAGNYWVTEQVHAGDSQCSTAVVAVESSYDGDYRAYLSRNGPSVDFVVFTLEPGGSGSTSGLKIFPPATYRFVAGAYPPLGPPQGDGSATLCEDWSLTLEAR